MGAITRFAYALASPILVALAGCTSTKSDDAAVSRNAGVGAAKTAADTALRKPVTAPSPGSGAERARVPAMSAAAAASASRVTVYKNPTCQCCEKWVDHLRKHGFEVVVHTATNLEEVKADAGVPEALATCHTALVGGYVVEGHVPADVIQRLLRERPAVAGIAVPGMPQGVPGMDGPVKDRYDVIAFARDGTSRVYESR